ncbi:hypothetical protein SJI19_21840 [Acerihabitans sp. TG2]|uniref:hypothetical protein n=1 Tax=Acerihabitans sp. TG2 TaxID=3096008 RepID=UPI002B236B21|nr:hypothetical protein [Acerihabitans sp. TG2]MEA9393146.1 hypothetical protein [Acerihabitans sp. TG2]
MTRLEKLTPQVCSQGRRRDENSVWSHQRMNSVTKNAGLPQLRCKAIAGRTDPATFAYEVMVMGQWCRSNYQFACWVVENGRWLIRDCRATV